MKKHIIIQARVGSTRLPAKTMLSLADKPVLYHIIERLKSVNNIDDTIIATTTNAEDDIIARRCENNSIKYFRGDSENVLKRYYDTAKHFKSSIIVRVTSDCPLIDPYIIQDMINKFDSDNYDYMSNVLDRIFPRGLDVELFTFKALETAYKNANDEFDLEHVTPYMKKHLKVGVYLVDDKYKSDARLTLDEIKDYQLISLLYDKFYKEGEIINTVEVIKYLEQNPNIKNINQTVKQKAG